MQMSEGVEWALHSCLNLAWAEHQAVTARKLAAFYDLPPAYLNRQLQALARAGIVASTSGPRGGFRLARAPEEITLLDVVVAIEGGRDAFRCQQIMRDGPGGRSDVDYRRHCLVSQAMSRAELAWRRELAAQTLADIRDSVEEKHPDAPRMARNRLAQPVR
ncbi:Rrf2 family transcriptional regulator [Streptomyces sp. AC563]|uniref:RrF2 family transcriptional regulator n=1 Tax=Streptomyces buecherae TaxID=2763006 RepID=UPI00164D7F6D|nr:Rrf2 family transcriptional regulator [Streptomyces buecherae]MBC3983213.1 Rrf2 family transcriptional regulator [Streptomyces buecherae]MBC3988771.1 Rrf2 family transcriptional regulator [Streptomyces buecherae]QNJ43181.1 Rrf2 family transcriptional regulator [Streptomyces buecherae]